VVSEGFRFGDARARDDRGGCCGKPVGCWLESQGCVHKVEKAAWQAEVAEQERLAEAWGVGYWQGVEDERTSQEVTGGEVPPGRVNPYRTDQP